LQCSVDANRTGDDPGQLRFEVALLARIRTAAVLGVEALAVDVEIDIANGLPSFTTVGLPLGAVKEGRERVAAAFGNSAISSRCAASP
jgi:hypothetical protein